MCASATGKTEEEVTSYCEQTITGSCNVTDVSVDLSAAVNKCVTDVKVTSRYNVLAILFLPMLILQTCKHNSLP